MEAHKPSTKSKKENKISESLIGMIYEEVYYWMRPNPKQPVYIQVLMFILKLPVVLIILTLSPILLLFMFLSLIVAL